MSTNPNSDRRLCVDSSIAGAFAARLHRELGGSVSSVDVVAQAHRAEAAADRIVRYLAGADASDQATARSSQPYVTIALSPTTEELPDAPVSIAIVGLDGDELAANHDSWVRSGLASVSRPVGRVDSETPVVPADPHASVLAGTYALLVTYACELAERAGAAPPRRVEIDATALLTSFVQHPIGVAQLPRSRRRSGRIGLLSDGVFECSDGGIYVYPVEDGQWLALFDEVVGDDASDSASRAAWMRDHRAEIDRLLTGWTGDRPTSVAAAALRARRVPIGVVNDPASVPRRPPSNDRGFDPRNGRLVPWLFDAPSDGKRSIPAITRLERDVSSTRPLDGLRVLDLTWAWAGPFATSLLAELGAEVINVEWNPRQSNLRVQPPFVSGHPTDAGAWWSANQRAKYSIGINLKHSEGRELVLRLAEHSHVVMENFAPGVTQRLRIDYPHLVDRNPALGYVSMSAFGHAGPANSWIGYGTQLWYESGLARTCINPSVDLMQMDIPYPDPVSGVFGALAALTMLRAGGGWADVSELESTTLLALGALAGVSRSDAGQPDVPRSTVSDIVGARAHDWPEDMSPEFRGSGVRLARSPFTLDGSVLSARRGAPRLFEHTELVLSRILGASEERIDRLRDTGAIACSDAADGIGQPRGN